MQGRYNMMTLIHSENGCRPGTPCPSCSLRRENWSLPAKMRFWREPVLRFGGKTNPAVHLIRGQVARIYPSTIGCYGSISGDWWIFRRAQEEGCPSIIVGIQDVAGITSMPLKCTTTVSVSLMMIEVKCVWAMCIDLSFWLSSLTESHTILHFS